MPISDLERRAAILLGWKPCKREYKYDTGYEYETRYEPGWKRHGHKWVSSPVLWLSSPEATVEMQERIRERADLILFRADYGVAPAHRPLTDYNDYPSLLKAFVAVMDSSPKPEGDTKDDE